MDTSVQMDRSALKKFYRKHAEIYLLPFWSQALDHQNGGIYTCYNNRGNVLISRKKYSWSQGRYLWLWSHLVPLIEAGRLKGNADHFRSHLQKTIQFIDHHVFLENGNCAFLLSETGKKIEPHTDSGYDTSIFADCFIVIGYAGYATLMKDPVYFQKAIQLYRNITMRIKNGDYQTDPYSVPNGFRSHAVSMILLHISQEMANAAETLGSPQAEAFDQDSILYMSDILDHFYQPDYTIVEYLALDPSLENTMLSRHRNPGHSIESMWFVIHAARKTGHSEMVQKAVQGLKTAIEIGWDIDFGGLFRFVDKSGMKPDGEKRDFKMEGMLTQTWDMKLWWPHAEALYATILGYDLTGDKELLKLHENIKSYTFNTFPNPDQSIGEWIQIRNRDGTPAEKVVALPVKDPFHILRSHLLILNLLEKNHEHN
jgi:N-acylglucosamine 2-epimerase